MDGLLICILTVPVLMHKTEGTHIGNTIYSFEYLIAFCDV
jgi:hypothetical protein